MIYGYIYGFITVVLLAIGIGVWTDDHPECDKIGARVFFLAPIWPLVVLYFIGKEIKTMWHATGWSK